MTRDTSIEIYEKMRDEGLLSERRFQCYDVFFQLKRPSTANEMMDYARRKVYPSRSDEFYFSLEKRIAEIVRLGVLYELPERKCLVTGNNCYTYAPTHRLPVKEVKLSKYERLEEKVRKARQRYLKLVEELKTLRTSD